MKLITLLTTLTLVWGALGWSVPANGETIEVVATASLTFAPPDVVLNVGDSIHWTGLQGGFHTVAETADANTLTYNGGFHSPAAGSEFTFTFDSPGDYFYICEPHVISGMRGTVTVIDSGNEPVPTLSEWGSGALMLLMLAAGARLIAKRQNRHPTL